MNTKLAYLFVASLLLTSACEFSSDSTSRTDDGMTTNQPSDVDAIVRITSLSESIDSFEGVQNVGYFEIDDSDQIPLVNADAVFFRVDGDSAQNNPVTDLLFTLGDSCFVKQLPNGSQFIFHDIEDNYETVSVGEVITLFEVDAPYKYSELAHRGLATEGRYINYLDLPYPSPQSLNVSAVGEALNAFSITVERPSSIRSLNIADGRPITSGKTISWVASEDTDTMLRIVFQPNTDGFTSFAVNCMLVDDGLFTLPTTLDAGAIDGAIDGAILQVATRLRIASKRVGDDHVTVLRGSSQYR